MVLGKGRMVFRNAGVWRAQHRVGVAGDHNKFVVNKLRKWHIVDVVCCLLLWKPANSDGCWL